MQLPDFTRLDHRPWPLPSGRWTWQQSWFDLLFAHWPIAVDKLRPLMPSELEIDTFDGTAWIGVVPFSMRIQHRRTPRWPGARYFPEINVRTYVIRDGKPGVWFFSLDAGSLWAVRAARRFFHLPYFHARFAVSRHGERTDYRSERNGQTAASFSAMYQPMGPVVQAKPGSLDHWLTERYCLYARSRRGQLYRGEIHHEPWPLQAAEAEVRKNTMIAALGLEQPDAPPLLHYSQDIHVALWPFVRIG